MRGMRPQDHERGEPERMRAAGLHQGLCRQAERGNGVEIDEQHEPVAERRRRWKGLEDTGLWCMTSEGCTRTG